MTRRPAARRLRVGLIGTGVGVRTYLPGFAATGRADVVAIAGSSPARSREVAAATAVPTAHGDFRALCADQDLDLICVTSPNEFHYEHFAAAAASGRPVVVEKPAAVDARDLRRFLRVPLAPGQQVFVDHQLRFNPYLRRLRACLAGGEIGRPYQLRIHQQGVGQLAAGVPWAWQFDEARGGGVRLAMGSHLVDLAGYLLGVDAWQRVTGSVDPVVAVRRDGAGGSHRVTADSAFSAMLANPDATALVSASAAAAGESLLDVDVLGTAGEAHFSLRDKLRIFGADGAVRVPVPEGVEPAEAANRVSVFKSSFTCFARALTAALLDGDAAAVADASMLADQESLLGTLDAILDSARVLSASPQPTGSTR
ncbi:Gfo/Idh/MocA family oxidoreductase [Streptomyces sp. V4-01]|uniref:Gfo/Idh/MocA family oxidoreductase n=1 Tax=Actinacidiphila polyblastidii TaxID=3110430 RepID=A0ABU7PCH1_9ACTN|nr:Gfo/Idh/MocA family oxidoreductase [Streptomyces sp. V4-01]